MAKTSNRIFRRRVTNNLLYSYMLIVPKRGFNFGETVTVVCEQAGVEFETQVVAAQFYFRVRSEIGEIFRKLGTQIDDAVCLEEIPGRKRRFKLRIERPPAGYWDKLAKLKEDAKHPVLPKQFDVETMHNSISYDQTRRVDSGKAVSRNRSKPRRHSQKDVKTRKNAG